MFGAELISKLFYIVPKRVIQHLNPIIIFAKVNALINDFFNLA